MSYSPYVVRGIEPDLVVGIFGYDKDEEEDVFFKLCEELPSRLIAYSFINYLNGGKGTLFLEWLLDGEIICPNSPR